MIARAFARDIALRLSAAGVPDAAFEAELIAREAGGLARAQYFAGAILTAREREQALSLLQRRLQGEPAAYISGRREFHGWPFAVGPGVLVPRPETELLVDLALEELEEAPGALVADIGTGSGCIAVAVALERAPGPTIALDLSPEALSIARHNALQLGAHVDFVGGNLAAPLGRADILLANLPYIPTDEIAGLQPEVRDWEPRGALDGGADGLALICQLVEDCAMRLRPRFLALEVGSGQALAVASLLAGHGAVDIATHGDLAGVERVVSAQWR